MSDSQFDQSKFEEIFVAYYARRRDEARKANRSFIHYTSADNALKLLKSQEVWLRRASVMNDFSEIQHGESCIVNALEKNQDKIRKILDGIKTGLSASVGSKLNVLLEKARNETYITCFSEHDNSQGGHESNFGRLSMWRAYGGTSGVGMVLKREAFFSQSEPGSGAVASPVFYCTIEEYEPEFLNFVERINDSRIYLSDLSLEYLSGLVSRSIVYAILSTKHRGFEEEREWRLIFSSAIGTSKHVRFENESIYGIPQRVCKFPLKNSQKLGLTGIEIPELLERLIIGPTKFPLEIYDAMISELDNIGVSNPHERMQISFIPIRSA